MKTTYPELEGKVVLITGAARGIGKSIAVEFAKQKAKLVIDDLPEREGLLKNTKDEINLIGAEAVYVIADVRKESEIKTLVAEAINSFGRIDVLINNAGIVYDIEWDKKSEKEWGDTLSTNLIGPYLLIKHAKDALQKSGGTIINISSTNAFKAMNPLSLDYDASKAGLITLTHNAAKALAPNIRVNGIAPGWVNTDMNSSLSDEIIKQESEKIFVNRFATPKEIAAVAVFLASDSATYINGTTITVDGGYQ
jgi:3-oxoacyl-[acyl-carrier protein] reductase